jgi:hypothetical protein
MALKSYQKTNKGDNARQSKYYDNIRKGLVHELLAAHAGKKLRVILCSAHPSQ